MGKLDSMAIIITGGSLGIGYAIAQKCVVEGAVVILVARNKNHLEKSLRELRNISRKDHRSYALDVGHLPAVQEFANWIKHQDVEPNGLVNCAGVLGPIGKTTEVDMRQFAEAIQTNFLGTVYMCHTIAPLLRSHTQKKIVNCSGGGGSFPFPNYSAYATSKIAVVRFTENLSLELANDDFDVNCIAPGFVVTRLHQETLRAGPGKAGESHFAATQKHIKRGGVPPAKSANLTAFLLSRDADGITGKYISAAWDPWQRGDFRKRLRTEKDFATVRRIDDQLFLKSDKV